MKRNTTTQFLALALGWALPLSLSATETLTFDTDLQGFAAGGDVTSLLWSDKYGGSMQLTADGGWAGNSCSLNLAEADPALWSEVQMATQNGGLLSFDLIVTGSEQTLTGDETPNWYQVVVVGNSQNAEAGGTGGWDQNTIDFGVSEAVWPLAPDTQTFRVEVPIRNTAAVDNDDELWWDFGGGWGLLHFGLNNQIDATTEAVVYIDNIAITAYTATPSEWPGGETYATDFSQSLLPYWSLIGWRAVSLPTPVSMMTANQSMQSTWGIGSLIGDSDGGGGGASGWYFDPDTGLTNTDDAGDPFDTPIPAIKTPTDLSVLDSGFGGDWLQNLPTTTRDGVATLTFSNLPPHTGIDFDFVLAAYDTIDQGDWFGNPGGDQDADPAGPGYNFRITVDGETVYEDRFNNSGTFANGLPQGVVTLGNQLNFSAQYRENWGPDTTGAVPASVNDRHSVAWAEDSAYNFNDLLNAVPHSADSVTITFEHAFSGGWGNGYQDEGIALDSFAMTLVGGPPPPREITDIQYDADAGTFRLTWQSDPDKTYTVRWSPDLSNWEADVTDEVLSDGASTTYPPLAEPAEALPVLAPEGTIFFRVEENP